MKKRVAFIFTIALFVSAGLCYAQPGKLPPFKMVQSNGKMFKAENLPIGKPIIIIYFSPDCDHCEIFMKDFLKKESGFKKASIAMITYLPVERVAKFMKDFSLNKYPNIYVGTEGNYFFVRNYYKIMDLPFAALYTKEGVFVKSYEKNIDLNDLSRRLNNLK